MSITGSLIGYENNNEINMSKKITSATGQQTHHSLLNITTASRSSMVKPCPSLNSSISNSIITTASSNISPGHHNLHHSHHKQQAQQNVKCPNHVNLKNLKNQEKLQKERFDRKHESHLHMNSLWSIWYGILVTLFQGYLALHGAYRFLGCSLIEWKHEPVIELNIQIITCGFTFLLLPFFFAAAVFKVGNLANDGIKLASMTHNKCSISPNDGLEEEAKGTLRALWTHGGPTSAFIHIVSAICLLIPRLLLEAKIIENGLLPKDYVWRTELDFLTINRDRVIVLSFMTSPYQNISTLNDTNNYLLYEEDTNSSQISNKNYKHEYKLTNTNDPLYYGGGSDLIEKFHHDDDFINSHENIQIELNETNIFHPEKITTTIAIEYTTSASVKPIKLNRTDSRRNSSRQNKKQMNKDKKQSSKTDVIIKPKPTQSNPITKENPKDSEIHIVKHEKLSDALPSGSIESNSKIIEIKPKKVKREAAVASPIITIGPEPPINILSSSNTSKIFETAKLNGFAGILQKLFGVEKQLDVSSLSHPPSIEFLNLLLALMVWSVRYPAVFWTTTKPFATVFSIQMFANTLDIIFCYTGISIMYKLLTVGTVLTKQTPSLLLNAPVTLGLFILSTILVIASSLIIYLYGHGRLSSRIRDRSTISLKNNETWIYFAHCASLCLVLALAVVKAPLIHDLSVTYKGSLDGITLLAALSSIVHLFLWIMLWLLLTAKRRWDFKLQPLNLNNGATQPLLVSTRQSNGNHLIIDGNKGISTNSSSDGAENTIYWPKLTPSSPKLKVTFNEVTSTSDDILILGENDGKRNSIRGATLCITSSKGETDDGDYATLRSGPHSDNIPNIGSIIHLCEYDQLPPPPLPSELLPQSSHSNSNVDTIEDNTSEEGKLLACVRDDSVTYASTRDLEPPHPPIKSLNNLQSPSEQLVSPLAPVMVTVHTNEAHIALSSTPRCLRRADSGVPNEALTPRSDTTSTTESTISPPERPPSETSSGVHSGEEREELVIRPRIVNKTVVKQPPPAIEEEPFGRSTNMKMSSFNINEGKTSATLPLTRTITDSRVEYNHCSTMPLPVGYSQVQYKPQFYTPTASKQQITHTTLPNGVRYSNPHFLRRIPYITKAESPYGHLGLGSGHHTFSKLLQDPLHSLVSTSIPEDRDSANYSMTSEQGMDCVYVNNHHIT